MSALPRFAPKRSSRSRRGRAASARARRAEPVRARAQLLARRPRRARLADRRRRGVLQGVRQRRAARQRSIVILGWDFHSRTRLHHGVARRAGAARRLPQLPREAAPPPRHPRAHLGLPGDLREGPRAVADLRPRLAAAAARAAALRRSLSDRRLAAPEDRGHRRRARVLRRARSHAQPLGHLRAQAGRRPPHQRGRRRSPTRRSTTR